MAKIELYDKKNYSIMCPICKKFLTKTDKDTPFYVKIACKRCKKWIWYKPKTKEYEIKDIPPRQTGSGMVFY